MSKPRYQFEEFEAFAQQFPQIVIDLYHFRLSMVMEVYSLDHEQTAKPYLKPHTSGVKVGRNDPCPCSSGKKYKHCCINISVTVH